MGPAAIGPGQSRVLISNIDVILRGFFAIGLVFTFKVSFSLT